MKCFRSDSAHMTDIGQSYAEKKSVTTVVPSVRTSDVDVVTLLMQTRRPPSPPHGKVGTTSALQSCQGCPLPTSTPEAYSPLGPGTTPRSRCAGLIVVGCACYRISRRTDRRRVPCRARMYGRELEIDVGWWIALRVCSSIVAECSNVACAKDGRVQFLEAGCWHWKDRG